MPSRSSYPLRRLPLQTEVPSLTVSGHRPHAPSRAGDCRNEPLAAGRKQIAGRRSPLRHTRHGAVAQRKSRVKFSVTHVGFR